MTTPTPDFAAITAKQQQTWATGDFHIIAASIVPVSDHLVETADPRPGQQVLDVACGSGNCALVAARRYADVTGVDFVPALIEHARARAAAEGVRATFQVGDAQALPFADGSFDVVLSVFGAMFAPDQEKTAQELLRVCKPGGTIAMANWTPTGFGGDTFKAMAAFAPPPPGLKPGVRWGTEAGAQELLGGAADVTVTPASFRQFFRSIDHMIEVFITWFGPAVRAYEAQDAAGKQAVKKALHDVFARANIATDGTAEVECDYVEVVARKKQV